MSENTGRPGVKQATPTHRLWRIAAVPLLFSSFSAHAAAPVLNYSTFLGGSHPDAAIAVRVDAKGNTYIAGTTMSANFPVTANALQKDGPGTNCPTLFGATACVSLFVSKFSPDGALLYSTYLGRGAQLRLIGMDVDGSGGVYLAGGYFDRPPEFPSLKPLNGFANPGNVFVLKLNTDGSALDYATGLPLTSGVFDLRGIAVDGSGSVYLTGGATAGLPVVNAFQPAQKIANFFQSVDSGQTWATGKIGGPRDLIGLVAVDPHSPQSVYAGLFAGLYRSADGGAHWTPHLIGAPADRPDPGGQLFPASLLFDPKTAGTLYMTTGSHARVYKSADYGATWRAAGVGIDALPRGLAIDPANPSVLYLATNKALLKSTDGAASWTPSGLLGYSVNGVAVGPPTSSTVYAATTAGVMKSFDGGATWSAVNNGLSGAALNVLDVTIDPVDARAVYATTAAPGSPYRSTDGGEHWAQGQVPATGSPNVRLPVIDPVVHTTLWARTDSGVLVSRDSGATWNFPPAQLPHVFVIGLDVSSTGTVYAVANGASLQDAFVMKLDPTGSNLVYSTYLGGSGGDSGAAIAVDSRGWAYIAGVTDSFDFPGAGGVQPRRAGGRDAFVSMLDASGRLAWSTYLGGSGEDEARGIAVDPAGNIHVAGWTQSRDLPLKNPSQAVLKDRTDGFAAKVKGDGSALLFSTYVGGDSDDLPHSVAADASGNTYLAGTTMSARLPVLNAIQESLTGNASTFAAGWNDDTGAMLFLTYAGSCYENSLSAVAADAEGSVYLAGTSISADLPRKYAFQDAFGGVQDAFAARIGGSAPKLAVNAVADAASYGPTVAPGELVTLFGGNLAIDTAQAGGFPLPQELADVKVTINGVPAPLYYVSPFQVNAQIPYETGHGAAQIQATSTAGTATFQAQVAPAAPAIFSLNATGTGAGAIQHGVTYEIVSAENPAVAGEIIAIYCTGLGAVDPPVATGAAAGIPLSHTREQAKAYIGGIESMVTYSGLTPGLAGLYQVNAVVPSGLAPGAQPVRIAIGPAQSRVVTMAVR